MLELFVTQQHKWSSFTANNSWTAQRPTGTGHTNQNTTDKFIFSHQIKSMSTWTSEHIHRPAGCLHTLLLCHIYTHSLIHTPLHKGHTAVRLILMDLMCYFMCGLHCRLQLSEQNRAESRSAGTEIQHSYTLLVPPGEFPLRERSNWFSENRLMCSSAVGTTSVWSRPVLTRVDDSLRHLKDTFKCFTPKKQEKWWNATTNWNQGHDSRIKQLSSLLCEFPALSSAADSSRSHVASC